MGKPGPATLYLYVEDVDAVYRRADRGRGEARKANPRTSSTATAAAPSKTRPAMPGVSATHIEDVSEEEMQRRIAKMGGAH